MCRRLVYLFIGEHIALVDFVKALHALQALGNGEYMVISIDDFIFDPESNAQEYTSRSKALCFVFLFFFLTVVFRLIFRRVILIFLLFFKKPIKDYLDPYLPTMKKEDQLQAFRSVLKLSPSHPRNPEFK